MAASNVPHPDRGGSPASAPTTSGASAAYRWALLAFLVIGLVQIFLAGYGVFALAGRRLGAAGETAFDAHRMLANVLSAVALVVLILAIVARTGRRGIALSAVLIVVVSPLQMVLARLGVDAPAVGGLHALVGIAAIGLAGAMHAGATRRSR